MSCTEISLFCGNNCCGGGNGCTASTVENASCSVIMGSMRGVCGGVSCGVSCGDLEEDF